MQINEAAKDSEISLKPGRYIRIGRDSRLPNPREEYELLKKDMFFALSLIESYGSGIRRAKEALKRNGSSSLVFYPDNEKDDYTNAVIFINPQFLKRKAEHNFTTKETTKENEATTKENIKTTKENNTTIRETTKESKKKNPDIQSEILDLIHSNQHITAVQIAEEIGSITANGVRYHLNMLKNKGIIRREGSTKKGKWIVS